MAQAPPVVVIGAGIVGVLTAYALAKQGKSVHVIDRARAPAEVCSFGNAGVLAVGHAKAWAGPAALASIARAVLGCEPGVRVTRLFDPALRLRLQHRFPRWHAPSRAALQLCLQFQRGVFRNRDSSSHLRRAWPHLRHGSLLAYAYMAKPDQRCNEQARLISLAQSSVLV